MIGPEATQLLDSMIPLGRHACPEEAAGPGKERVTALLR